MTVKLARISYCRERHNYHVTWKAFSPDAPSVVEWHKHQNIAIHNLIVRLKGMRFNSFHDVLRAETIPDGLIEKRI